MARRGYERALRQDSNSVRANLRLGILLSWEGKLDSSLVLISRARASDPRDTDMALTHARVISWDKRYDAALALYDSILAREPGQRGAELGRAQALAWSGKLGEAHSVYGRLIERDSSDRDARLGQAQVNAWRGNFEAAEEGYRSILAQNTRDVDALAGLGYIYYWRGDLADARRQVRTAFTVDSMHSSVRELRRTLEEASSPAVELTAAWSNDSDHNTTFWQTLGSSVAVGGGLTAFGSVNALQASDPFRKGTRVGMEAGLAVTSGKLDLLGAAGARRIMPEVAASRTAATYRGRLGYRPAAALTAYVGYSRSPFDEIAAVMESELDTELVEVGIDGRPFRRSRIYAAVSGLWFSDGNRRTGVLGGFSHNLHPRFSLGLFGRTLTYAQRGVGYFSPDRFFVLEATARYALDTRKWGGSLAGGLGAQQIGERGVAQTEWHLDGRVSRRWGIGNRIELFGLLTNSAVSSTSGAFRYRSAGLSVRLGL